MTAPPSDSGARPARRRFSGLPCVRDLPNRQRVREPVVAVIPVSLMGHVATKTRTVGERLSTS